MLLLFVQTYWSPSCVVDVAGQASSLHWRGAPYHSYCRKLLGFSVQKWCNMYISAHVIWVMQTVCSNKDPGWYDNSSII